MTNFDVLQEVFHICDCQPIEERVRLVHLHSQIVIFCTDVLGQQVNGLGPTIADSDLRPADRKQILNIHTLQSSGPSLESDTVIH